jgi:hypothetical protein
VVSTLWGFENPYHPSQLETMVALWRCFASSGKTTVFTGFIAFILPGKT